jgi:sulfate transport system substrate-binding protein
MNRRHFLAAASAAGLCALGGCTGKAADVELLNVSYDPTRELYRKINRLFAERYGRERGKSLRVRQSHGGSGSQARAVIDGIPADVVTLAMWNDIDNIRKKGLIAKGWESRPEGKGSLPYHSTIVFVVRKGNPHGIKDWNDLIQDGVKLITPNPKTSGGAKLILLGAWGAAKLNPSWGIPPKDLVTEMYRRVPVLDTGSRGATVTFARKNIGDVHLTWENEAYLEKRELKDAVEVVHPRVSIRAEPHVALVDANVDRKGTRAAAEEYLRFLFEPEAQEVIADNFYRPADAAILARHAGRFEPIHLFRADDPALGLGDWNKIQTDFFAEGGVFDQIYQGRR